MLFQKVLLSFQKFTFYGVPINEQECSQSKVKLEWCSKPKHLFIQKRVNVSSQITLAMKEYEAVGTKVIHFYQ